MRRFLVLAAVMMVTAGWVGSLEVGDDRPALSNYSINNVGPNYHGPWLNINSYNGKGIVVVHWKAS